MQHVVATRGGFRPARIVFEIRGEKTQAASRVRAGAPKHGANVGFAFEIAHCGAHVMARVEKLKQAMARDEAGAARDQDGAQEFFRSVSGRICVFPTRRRAPLRAATRPPGGRAILQDFWVTAALTGSDGSCRGMCEGIRKKLRAVIDAQPATNQKNRFTPGSGCIAR